MKKIQFTLSVLFITLLIGCKSETKKETAADSVFTNGKVYTVNESQPWAEAVAVTGNKIVFVGSTADAQAYIGEGTETTDLAGKMMLPGFVDSHNHLIAADWIGQGILLYDATNKEETLKMVKDYADANPDLPVIYGAGWATPKLGGLPTAEDLDAIIPDRPVLLIDYTSHEAWMNSATMKDQNITKDTPDAIPGTTYWVRDDAGNPTGVAIEFQWLQIYLGLGLWQPDTMMKESILKLMGEASSYGTTSVFGPGLLSPTLTIVDEMLKDYETAMEVIDQLIKDGKMPLRSFSMPAFKTEDATPDVFISFTKRMKEKYNSDMHGVTGIKIHPESGIINYGAPLLKPYEGTDSKGGFGVTPERTMELVMAANKEGLDVAIHTEGSASTRAAIDAFEASIKAGNTNVRNQLHHYMLVHPDDHQRVIDNKMLVNATPSFTNTFGNQDKDYEKVLGKERINEMMGRYPDLAHAGLPVGLGSDYPGTPISMQAPLQNIQAAVTMTDPSNPDAVAYPTNRKPMTLEQAIRSFAIDGALFMHMEDKIGSIEVGKLADLVILEKNLFDVDKSEIQNVKIMATILDGKYMNRAD
ncbi:amidohydrolase [Algibacter mikhailovii]|uniref:Amidohydrolase n=1 Tax=Algibacter mikhailovii TaxID=425498 RepID=A0A918QVK5_9FLAO|nr:amidohydrolase [Algibacter mikhailovii]GGZ71832.1 putative amidohydrolase [Algibacter mikhailovii]